MRRVISLLIIVVLLIVSFNLIKSILSSSQKLNNIGNIEDKIIGLEKENSSLKQDLQERSTNFYLEKEARDKLNYGKPGETSIVVTSPIADQEKGQENKKDKSNLEMWVDLVFN